MKIFLKEARKAAGYTQEEAASITGIALGTLRRWEQGVNEPDMGSIIQLANLYRTSTDNLLGSEFSSADVKPRTFGWVDVPLFGKIAAGTPIEMDATDEVHPIPEPLHLQYPDAFLLKVEGDSMNRCFPNGCYALVNPCSEIAHDGKPYALCVNGYDAMIKRVRRLNNGFELVPDSTDPTYKPQVFDYGVEGTDEISVIGEVVWHVIPWDWEY